MVPRTVRLNLTFYVLKALLLYIHLGLRLGAIAITAHVQAGIASSSTILCLIDRCSRWCILLLAWRQDRLLHHDLVLILLVLVLEVSPLGQDLHGLNVFDGGQLLPIIFVAAQRVEVDLLAEAFVLVLDNLQDVVDLLAVEDFLIVHTRDGVEDGPHYFGVVHSTKMITNVQAEDNLVQFRFLDTDTLVTEWRGQLSKEIWESDSPHVQLTHWVVLGPGVLECLDVFLFESQNIILILSLLVVIETLTDNGNEYIHENEERYELE